MGQQHNLFWFGFLLSLNVLVSSIVHSGSGSRFQGLKDCLIAAGVRSTHVVGRDIPSTKAKYSQLNYQSERYGGHIRPLGYLIALKVSDIQAGIACALRNKVQIIPRSGGHSFTKYSFGNSKSLVIDLGQLNQVTVDPLTQTAQFGPGTLQGPLAHFLWTNGGFIFPYGFCPTVGVSGFILGGGHSMFSKMYGMAIDELLEVDLVTFNGTILTASSTTNPDLFWALRGGGGGNFGIVSRFKVRIRQGPPTVLYGRLDFPTSHFPQVFNAWQTLIPNPDLPKEFFPIFFDVNKQNITLIFVDLGSARGSTILQTFLKPLPTPISTLVKTFPFPDYMVRVTRDGSPYTKPIEHFNEFANVTRTYDLTYYAKVKSFYSRRPLTSAEIQGLYLSLIKFMPDECLILKESYGGTILQVPEGDTAFIHRSTTLYNTQLIYHTTSTPDAAYGSQTVRDRVGVNWVNTFWTYTLLNFRHNETYVNYMDDDLQDYLSRYYGSALPRLRGVKRLIDPNNVFHYPQSIPV